MQWWQHSWQFLTKPSEAIKDFGEAQRAALFSAVLLFLTCFIFVATPILIILPDYENSADIYLFVSIVISFLAYIFSRTQYYRWVARLYIWLIVLLLFYIFRVVAVSHPETIFSFLVFPIIVCALVLSVRETVLTLAILFFLLCFLIINMNFPSGMVNSTLLVLGVSVLTLLFANINQNYRQEAFDSEIRFRELMNANSEGILVLDYNDARILDSNPAFNNFFDYTEEEIIGHYPVEFVAQNSKSLVRNIWNEHILNVTFEVQVVHHSATNLYVDITLKPYTYRQKPAYVLTIVDATERKQTERLLVESEKRFKAIFEQSFQQIGVLGRDGLILELNQQALKMFAVDTQSVRGKHLWDLEYWANSDETRENVREMIAKAALGETVHQQIHAKNRQQEDVYLDFSLKPVFDANGQIYMLIAESRDVTSQYLAEQKRLESELRYQALFNHTVDAVFIIGLDDNATIITANGHALLMLGCELEDVEGVPAQIYIAPDEYNQALDTIETLKVGQDIPPLYERRVRRKDGTIFPAEITVMMVRDSQGQPLYIQSLVRDISERKRAEAERLRFLNAIESSLNEIYVFDADTLKFQFVNAGAKRNLGYTGDELLNMTPLDIKPLFDADSLNSLLEPLRQKSVEKLVFETIHRRKDGTRYPTEASLQLIEQGDERTFLAIVSDTTERKQLEQAKFEFRIEQERTRVLQSFIEQASHYFRTPITNIKTSLYVLERVKDNSEKYEQHLNTLNRESERLTRLIEDLLTMLRLQKPDTEFDIAKISILQLLREIQTVQEGHNYYANYKWHWSIEDDKSIVIGDKQFLSRAILNIIDNAVLYSPRGTMISVRAYHNEPWLVIDIEDEGIGIATADLPYIFDEFYRSNTSMEQDSTRSGLGLTIAQHIIKRHRGVVHVQSKDGQGTLVQILLPLNLAWESDAPTLPQMIL